MYKLRYISILLMLVIFSLQGKAALEEVDSLLMAPKPVVILFDYNVVCQGDSVRLEIDYSKASSIFFPEIVWSTGDTSHTIIVHPSDSLKIWVRLLNAGTFVGADTLTLYVTTLPIVQMVNDTICKGNDATMGVIGGAFYAWSTYGTTQYINVRPLHDTSYRVRVSNYPILEAGYSNNCYIEDSVFVKVNETPQYTIIGANVLCPNMSYTLRIEDATDIIWSTGAIGSFTDVFIHEDSLIVSVIATDRYGCRGEKIYKATASFPQGAIVSSVDTLCFGDELVLRLVSPLAESVRWYNGSTDIEIRLQPKNTLICYVDIVVHDSIGGCTLRVYDTTYVKECSNVVIPNAFKLGGISEEIKPIGIYQPYKTYYFAIYTRNGKLIFESHDFNLGWDGKYKGNWVQAGVYVYYYSESAGNRKLDERGTITVVR